jgi:3-hydroxybutyryl-CoA dehydrogenase
MVPNVHFSVSSVAVIGAGTMGSGIAQVIAQADLSVTLIDRTEADLERAKATIESSLSRLVSKQAIDQSEADQALTSVTFSTELSTVASADFVVEAIFEDASAKRELIREVSGMTDPETVIASNTSSISITELATAAQDPTLVVGMHFFNPVPVLPLVEIVTGLQTADITTRQAVALAEAVGKSPVVVRDSPGFVANRILIPMINEAILCYSDGVAGREEIDLIMKLGASHPIGPLALADLIGLDICLSILEVLHREFGEDKYRPAPLLRRMVAAGQLGRKTGQGFYSYR